MVYIPGFLINKVYESGSLRNTGDGFVFSFCNRMTPLEISGLRDLKLEVDGGSQAAENIRMTLGGRPIELHGGTLTETVTFARESKLEIRVELMWRFWIPTFLNPSR